MSTTPNVTESTSRSKRQEKPADRLAAALRGLLLERRQSGHQATTIEQLAHELGETVPAIVKVLTKKSETPEFCCVAKLPATPVSLAADIQQLFDSPSMLRFVADRVREKRTAKRKSPRGDLKALVSDSGLSKSYQTLLREVLERRQVAGTLPAELTELLALTTDQLAQRLIETLTPRDGSEVSGILGIVALSERSRSGAKPADIKKALKAPAFAAAVVSGLDPRTREAVYFLRAALRAVVSTLLEWSLEATLSRQPTLIGRSLGKKGKSTLFTADELCAAVVKGKSLQLELADAFESLAAGNQLGPKWAWLYLQGQRRFFRPSDLEPVSPSVKPSSGTVDDFAPAFELAFTHLNDSSGGGNFIKVRELRQALPQFTSEQFEAGLRALRSAGRYTMDSAHGGLVRLTEDERLAGIQEGSSLLVYVSRK